MKRNRLIAFVVIFGFSAFLTLPAVLNAQETETPFLSSRLSAEESKITKDEAVTFAQILYLHATMALEKPSDLRLCAYEMFRLKPNENSCRDKHSVWHSKEEYKLIQSDNEGKFGGVGLEVSYKDGKVMVISPIDGTPAHRAGMKSGDVIIKIDNKPVLNIMDAAARMRGEPGVPVEITVKRGGQELTLKVVREVIAIHAVSTKTLNSPSGAIGYVKVKTFNEIMPEKFREEITGFRSKGITKVILDFRDNPGGPLNSALDILYNFARPGDILLTMRERNKETIFNTNYVSSILDGQEIIFEGEKVTIVRELGTFRDMKIVVLINKGSASASEIFAGTMKDWGFPVIGSCSPDNSCSFGKGVGQTVFPLLNGSALRLTTFEFLVGNSKTKINDVGVVPNHKIPESTPSSSETTGEDLPLKKAIEIFSP